MMQIIQSFDNLSEIKSWTEEFETTMKNRNMENTDAAIFEGNMLPNNIHTDATEHTLCAETSEYDLEKIATRSKRHLGDRWMECGAKLIFQKPSQENVHGALVSCYSRDVRLCAVNLKTWMSLQVTTNYVVVTISSHFACARLKNLHCFNIAKRRLGFY